MQCEKNLDPSLICKDNIYQELDEKIMLGLRVKEGINIQSIFKEQKWTREDIDINLRKLLKEWEKFIESGHLIKRGNRFYLTDPKGMELSNQVLISMFRWWEKIS